MLQELALAYVARFATSRAKLVAYLERKLRERGWSDTAAADPGGVADRIAGLGYIDDGAFAGIKTASLLRRGYGKARVKMALHASGIGEQDRAEALEAAERGSLDAALRFAERKRIGPYAEQLLQPPARDKALAAMLRAGHDFATARRILGAAPGDFTDFEPEE
ncbi:regulatory protein RecX [Sphingomonas sp. LHG3406-1]|uniref:regulatory protein RecX n=1 Tax=Sphingomonas sp. LHG3406-1 TaxID=2804617 RepID=UPI00261D9204|nr:regulatory protein RecX [Sphingomonas sp. LHG3406-1]